MLWLLMVLCALVLFLGVSVAQQGAPPSCEDQLRQAQAQLGLTQAGRTQSEFLAADAIAALRKRVESLEQEKAALRQEPAPVPPPETK